MMEDESLEARLAHVVKLMGRLADTVTELAQRVDTLAGVVEQQQQTIPLGIWSQATRMH